MISLLDLVLGRPARVCAICVVALFISAWAVDISSAASTVEEMGAPAESAVDQEDVEEVVGVDESTDTSPNLNHDEDEEAEYEVTYVGWLELSGMLRDGPPPYSWLGPDDVGVSLMDVVQALEDVETGAKYVGVVVYLDSPQLSITQTEEIIESIGRVRAEGKQVLVFAERFDLRTYLIACASDRVLLQEKGFVELTGLGVEEMYLAGLLEKVGVKADLLQVGRFKGADEQMTRTGPSEAWDQNIDSLLDDLYGHMITQVAKGRDLSKDQVEKALADCWSMADDDYVQRGLVDDLTDRSLTDITGRLFGEEFYWDDLLDNSASGEQYENPFSLFRALFQDQEPVVRRDSLAVIHGAGPIVMGADGGGDMFGGDVIDSDIFMTALEEAMDEPLIKGVVIRIDSPGGSALASEILWQSVRELSEQKPVYVSIGPMAASGGYYIASAGDIIYVSPTTIVGSIGVVGGKMALGGLYEKIGISVHRRSRGPLADMFNSVEPFTSEQRHALRAAFDRVYTQFTGRVATGRGDRLQDVTAVAEGRLFTGAQAVQNGMADRVGGLKTALAALAEELELAAGTYDVVDLPHPQGFAEILEDMLVLKSDVGRLSSEVQLGREALLTIVRAALGQERWRAAQPVLRGLTQLRSERVLTLMPTALFLQ